MDLLNLNQTREEGKRLAEIVQVLGRYGLADWFGKISVQSVRDLLASTETQAIADLPVGERLRLALTELGTTYIKLGQVLSTRADLVGPDIATELRKLQADTPADPAGVVRQTILEELGQTPEDLFAEFAAEAFSSASVGQVHRARLADGQQVAVKVQHAGIQETVRIDLELLGKLAKLLEEYVPEARNYQPEATTREFRRTLLRELDFTCERSNMETFTRNFEGDETVHIPTAYKDRSSKRVLTMELLDGIPGSKPERLDEAGVDLNLLAKDAATIFMNMIFRDGFYHADPHPGNFFVLDGRVVGLLDCGMVGRLDDSTRELFEDLLLMLMHRDAEGLADTWLRAGSAPADVDRMAFRADVSDLLVQYGSQSLEDFDIGGAMDQLMDIVRRHHVVMPSEPESYLGPEARGMMAAIGIEKGKPFAPDARMKKVLTDAAAIGNGAARAISYFPRDPGNLTYKDSDAWVTAYADKDTTFTRNGAYRLDPRVLFHFGYICVSSAMAMTVAGKGSDYSMGMLDSEGKVLDGSKTYRLRIPPNPPAKDFWAITMYDTQTRSQLQTDQQFPTKGSQDKGIKTNADGSMDIYFSPKAPAGKEGNWLQTIPGKSWFIALRIYGPDQPWIDQTWRPGKIELVK